MTHDSTFAFGKTCSNRERNTWLVALMCLFALPAFTQPQTSLIFQKNPASPLVDQGVTFTIYQSADRLMWMGHSKGLIAYDGYDYQLYPAQTDKPNLPQSHEIYNITEDEQSRLWLIGRDNSIDVFDRQNNQFHHITAPGSDQDMVIKGSFIVDGQLWFAKRLKGLVSIDVDDFSIQTHSLSGATITSFLHHQGHMYVGTQQGHIHRFDSKDNSWHDTGQAFSQPVVGLIHGDNGLYAYVSSVGLFDVPLTEKATSQLISKSGDMASGSHVNMTLVGHNIWLSDYEELKRINTQTSEVMTFQPSIDLPYQIHSNRISSHYLAPDNTLWVYSIEDGLGRAHLSPKKIKRHHLVSADSPTVWSITAGDDGSFWLSGRHSILTQYQPNTKTITNHTGAIMDQFSDRLSSDQLRYVLSVLRNSSGQLFVPLGSGMLEYKPSQSAYRMLDWPVALKNTINSPKAWIKDDLIWGLTSAFNGGPLWQYNTQNGRWQTFIHPQQQFKRLLLHDGAVWLISTNNRLFRFDTKDHNFEELNPIKQAQLHVRSLAGFESDRLWLGTDSGLYSYDVQTQSLKQHLLHTSSTTQPVVYTIIKQNPNEMWLGTSLGLIRHDLSTQISNLMGTEDGMIPTGFGPSAAWLDAHGSVWMGTYLGLIEIDPAQSLGTEQDPGFMLREWTVGEQSQKQASDHWPEQVTLGHKQRYLQLNFAKINHIDAHAIVYRYRLNQGQWRNLSNSRTLSFSALSPGQYQLDIQASDRFGRFTEQMKTIQLDVKPSPFASTWAWLTYALLFFGLLFSYLWQQRRKRNKIKASERRLRAVLWGSGDGYWDANLKSRAMFQGGLEFMGMNGGVTTLPNPEWSECIHPDHLIRFQNALADCISGRATKIDIEYQVKDHRGHWKWISDRGKTTQWDSDNKPLRMSGTYKDITHQKQSEQKMYQMLTQDSLTSLPNRLALTQQIKAWIQSPPDSKLVVITLGIDHFKKINDIYGMGYGDRILKQLGHHLQRLPYPELQVYRTGGDEFTLIHALNGDFDVTEFESTWGSFCQNVSLSQDLRSIACGMGYAIYPDDCKQLNDLIRCATISLYDAKKRHKGAISRYNAPMDDASTRLQLIDTQLELAIANNELKLVFQPKVNLSSDQVQSAEALLRWNHGKLGEIGPSEFIPLAEKNMSIIPIGLWLLDQIFEQYQSSPVLQSLRFKLAINLSPIQLASDAFLNQLQQLIKKHNMPAEHIEFEITETAVMEDFNTCIPKLEAIRDMGCHLSLDDFGTGLSSLAYINELPFDGIKLDKSLLSINNNHNRILYESIVMMSHKLGLEVTGEGVEKREQMAYLKKIKCDLAQGFLISLPLEMDAFIQFIQQEQPSV